MYGLEQALIELLLNFFSHDQINAFLRTPQHTAIILGGLIAVAGAVLGTYLLLRGLALTSDAISHTVLLGIVVAFLIMTAGLGLAPDLSSPWLIVGAAAAGVITVILTEAIQRSGLVKQDAALGLAFPLLFAIAVILISRYADNVHLDTDSVLVGEIGMAWANTNSHCLEQCETIVITPDDPRAQIGRQCVNCRELGISPRDEGAVFREVCLNCGTYSPGQAWAAGLLQTEPVLVFWPKAITVMLALTLITIGFVVLLYKELKLSTFDAALAAALGFRPGLLHYALMVLVSLVAVGAFDAVGSILVIAFFIIPPAAAYLLSDRLSIMLLLGPLIGMLGAYFGYDLARGSFLGLFSMGDLLAALNRTFGLNLVERWDSSISASMVLMMFFFFIIAWVFSPKYGLISTLLRRANQRRRFADQVVLGHIQHHQQTAAQAQELNIATLHEHFHWPPAKMKRVLGRLRARHLIEVRDPIIALTPRGEAHLRAFREQMPVRNNSDRSAETLAQRP
ncbi:MAG: metal ABC transporter permease [Aggregatilineales bacterium]